MSYLPLCSSFYRKGTGMGRTGGSLQYGQLEDQDLVLGISATGTTLKKARGELVRFEKVVLSEKQEEEPASPVGAGEGRSNYCCYHEMLGC